MVRYTLESNNIRLLEQLSHFYRLFNFYPIQLQSIIYLL